MEFPRYTEYISALSDRDQGVMLVAMIAFSGLVWLWLGRFNFPKLLPVLRAATVLLFFTTLIFAVFSGVGN